MTVIKTQAGKRWLGAGLINMINVEENDMERIVAAQRAFFYSGATKSYRYRLDALMRLEAGILGLEGEICRALRSDLNKPEAESYMTEIGMVLEELSYAKKHLRRWMRPQRKRTPLSQFPAKSTVYSEPYGVALIMAPWNYPFQLCISPLIGSICGGNCTVLKPSAYAPATSAIIKQLLNDAFDPNYVAVIEGGRAENEALLEQRFDYIFFTGSVAVGKLVMEKAAKNLTPISLELGGKSPVIVHADAKIELAAKRIAFGKCLNAGQTCVAPDYILVHRSVKQELIDGLKDAIKSFFPDGYGELVNIVNDKHFERVMGLMKGEKIVFGGSSDPKSRFIEPTILDDVTFAAPVMQEEIFGPLFPILTYDHLDEAIKLINDRPKPLALYLFTTSKAVEKKVLEAVSFGGGCINDTIIHLATSEMGFGGVGESGMGSYHGKQSFDTFTHYKSIVKKSNRIDLAMRYRPYSDSKLKIIRKFLK